MASTALSRKGRRSRDYQDRRERFDTAWQGTASPAIADYLPTADVAEANGYARRQLLIELIEIDLECRWRPEFPRSHFDSTADVLPTKPRLEQYIAQFPELGPLEELPADLILQEYKVRCEAGETPSHDEYVGRFPSLGESLRGQLRDVDTNMREPTPRVYKCPQCRNSIVVSDLAATAVKVITCKCGEKVRIVPIHDAWSAGDHVGDYELVKELGWGSFATVWLAFDANLERHVALKLPYRERGDAKRPDLTTHEARTLAKLRHPNIVQVYALGKGEIPYIASEYIKGSSLDIWLRSNPPQPRQAAELCRKVALALHYLHTREQRYVHRDVKPSNILVDEHGEPHLADFGLAKSEAPTATLASSGEMVGTLAYMPPEQATGKGNEADGRADVYSLGVVFYEMLAGTLPFQGDKLALLRKIKEDDPPKIAKHQPNTPRDLETICLKCLEKAPNKRFATAAELAEELGRYLRGEPILTRPATVVERLVKWAKRHPARATAAASSTVAAAAIALAVTLGAWRHFEILDEQVEVSQSINDIANEIVLAKTTEVIEALKNRVAEIRSRVDGNGHLSDQDEQLSKLERELTEKRRQYAARERVQQKRLHVSAREEKLAKSHSDALALLGWFLFVPEGETGLSRKPSGAPDAPRTSQIVNIDTPLLEPGATDSVDDSAGWVPTLNAAPRADAAISHQLFVRDKRQAWIETQKVAREGLRQAGVYFPRATAGGKQEPLWDALAVAYSGRDVGDDTPAAVEQQVDAPSERAGRQRQMAYELVLLHAFITYLQSPDENAANALREIDVVLEHQLPDGMAAADSATRRHAYHRLRAEFQRSAAMKPAASERPMNEAPLSEPSTAFDFFAEGCRSLGVLDANGEPAAYDQALAHFEEAFHRDPENVWTKYFMGLCQARRGELKAAEQALTECVPKMRGFPWAYVLRGMVRHMIYRDAAQRNDQLFNYGQRFDDAASDLEEGLRIVNEQLKKPRGAHENAADDGKGMKTANLLRARINLSLGALYFDGANADKSRLEIAGRYFAKVATPASEYYHAFSYLAIVRARQAKLGDAVDLASKAIGLANDSATTPKATRCDLRLMRGEFLVGQHNYRAAVDDFAAAASLADRVDQKAYALVQQAWVLGFPLEETDTAIAACKELLGLVAGGESPPALRRHIENAHLMMALLRLSEADAHRRQAVAGEKSGQREAVARARANATAAKRLAVASLDAYLGHGATDPKVFEMRANLRARMPKPDRDLVEAAVDFGRAAALYRDAGETVAACRSTIQRGACLLKLGQTAQAVVAFGDALQIAAANHRSVERDDLDKLAELRRGALLHRGVTLASLALGSRSSCATALADAELAVELGDNASTLYLAAGIYALAAREAWQDPERMKELFHKRAERSLSLLARALEGSSPTTAEGARVRRFHAPASPSNPSPIFYALRNEPEYLRLVKIYCQPVRGDRDNTLRKVSASGERGMP